MKKKELLKMLERIDDDFEIKFNYRKELKEEELDITYPMPYEYKNLSYNGYDIGYSSKVLSICLDD